MRDRFRVHTNLLHNLADGLRLLAFLPVDGCRFAPSLRQVVWLGAQAGALWLGFDRLTLNGEESFAWSSIAQVSWIAVVVVAARPQLWRARDDAHTLLSDGV